MQFSISLTARALVHIRNEFGEAQHASGKTGRWPSAVGSSLRAARPKNTQEQGPEGRVRQRGCQVLQRQFCGDIISQTPLMETRLPKKNYISPHLIM